MKKFGTPIGAAPGVASEKVGFAGVGTPSGRWIGRGASGARTFDGAFVVSRSHSEAVVEGEVWTEDWTPRLRLPPLRSRHPWSVMRPEPARPLRRPVPLPVRPPVRSRPPTAPGVDVAPGVASA